MIAGLTGIHLLVIALVVVLLFGATKLPIFARGLGQSIKVLRTELHPDAASVRVPAEAPITTPAP
ncbi:twin-arginine translocase TatA/TatE family subunit [uncultured Amnibacterium sp.]|uniref:twin-arginine translocase TatA/TatE family subunit n=1 Tax=uncultured Amnibacterium sp. TaxID=1631851 RepID=UPI0035CA3D35